MAPMPFLIHECVTDLDLDIDEVDSMYQTALSDEKSTFSGAFKTPTLFFCPGLTLNFKSRQQRSHNTMTHAEASTSTLSYMLPGMEHLRHLPHP
jgi:hypothetical protein